jgi:hypothetical protein
VTVVVTARVPDGLAAWAEEYAGRREVPRAVIVEAALEHFRDFCEKGVPDLPERRGKGRPKVEDQDAERAVAQRPAPVPGSVSAAFAERGPVDYAAAALERQRRLNAAKGRAS